MNKKLLIALTIFAASATYVNAQNDDDNWVSNPGFEDTGTKKLKKDKSIHFATGWTSITKEKADLYTSKNKDILTSTNENTYGHEKPEGGDNYAGIVAYSFGDKQARTYLMTELIAPMKKDQEYCVKMKVSLADNSKYAVNNLAIHLSKEELTIDEKRSILVDPHVTHSQNKVFNATFGWETICGVYKAKGGEKFLNIGNFSLTKGTKNEKVIKPKGVTRQLPIAYYYIDDVEVFILDSIEQCQCERKTEEKAHIIITEDYSSNEDFTPEEKVAQVKVMFDHLQTDVTDLYVDKINQLISVMNDNPDMVVEMHAHSEKSEVKAGENNENNKEIAKKRADNVMDVLAKAGIDKSRIIVKIHDDAEPADEGTDETAKALNRRVEFNVQE